MTALFISLSQILNITCIVCMIHNNLDETHGTFSIYFLSSAGKTKSCTKLQYCHRDWSDGTQLLLLVHDFVLQCSKPVIAAVLSACVREGIDMLLVHDFVLQCPKPVITAVFSACVWFMILCCCVLSQ